VATPLGTLRAAYETLSQMDNRMKLEDPELVTFTDEVKAATDIVQLVGNESELQQEYILAAISRLTGEVNRLTDFLKTETENATWKFQHQVFEGGRLRNKIKDLRATFNDAKLNLALSIQAACIGIMQSAPKGDIVVNIDTVDRVNAHFLEVSGLGEGLQIERLLKDRGREEDDGWHLFDKDITLLGAPPPYIA
jgi:hypothetical protein